MHSCFATVRFQVCFFLLLLLLLLLPFGQVNIWSIDSAVELPVTELTVERSGHLEDAR
jgi:hypothetical protein